MIPCPVCLMVLDGHGGRCHSHHSWSTFKAWLPGAWPTLQEIVAGVAPISERERPRVLADRMAESHHALTELARKAIAEAAPRPFSRGLFVGFRHFRDEWPAAPRCQFSATVDSIVLPLLVQLRVLEHDQVEGISHLFYELTPGERLGPEAPHTPGVQLLIFNRGT